MGEPEQVKYMLMLEDAWHGTLHRAAVGCITHISTTGKASRSMALLYAYT